MLKSSICAYETTVRYRFANAGRSQFARISGCSLSSGVVDRRSLPIVRNMERKRRLLYMRGMFILKQEQLLNSRSVWVRAAWQNRRKESEYYTLVSISHLPLYVNVEQFYANLLNM